MGGKRPGRGGGSGGPERKPGSGRSREIGLETRRGYTGPRPKQFPNRLGRRNNFR